MSPENTGSQTLERHSQWNELVFKNGMMNPAIDQDGRIRLPGISSGFSMTSYLPLVHLYASILEASRILDRYRHELSLESQPDYPQEPLTALAPSNLLNNLYYKREDQTITRAYKVRGAVVGMAKVMESQKCNGFLAVSTGNHALGVLKAAQLLRPESVRIVVPQNTATGKLEKINQKIQHLKEFDVNAQVVFAGETFDEARIWAMDQQAGEYYLDPYSDPWVVAGQGTIGLELFRQVTPLLEENSRIQEVVLVAPIGGGGLLAGTATALKMAAAWDPRFRNVNVRVLGLRLGSMDSVYGDAIKVNEVASVNRMLFDSLGVSMMDIDDSMMAAGMMSVYDDLDIQVEGACGATLYPIIHHADFNPSASRLVVSVLSGGNVGVLPAGMTEPHPSRSFELN